jgi:hypothetical protein
MPLLPSAAGQSLWSSISTGLTSHQIGVLLTRLIVVRRHEYRHCGRTSLPESRQSHRQVDGRSVHRARARHGAAVRVRALSCDGRICLPSFGHKTEKLDQHGSQSGATELSRPSSPGKRDLAGDRGRRATYSRGPQTCGWVVAGAHADDHPPA